MSKNGGNNVGKKNNIKEIKFHFQKSVQVTKVFVRENHQLTTNETIFTMIDTDHPGMVKKHIERGELVH